MAKALRVRQWVKNLVLFVAITFAGKLFELPLFLITAHAFLIFCLLSGGIYLLNDIVDAPKDRLHPFKRHRPIARGTISIPTAFFVSVCFIFTAEASAFLFFPRPFFLVAMIFLILQLSYTVFLKHITLIDVITIASAFILRIFAGETATGYHINIWLFLTVISLALFLALGKRRSELTLLAGGEGLPPKTRETLSHYSEKMLDVYLSMFSTATWLTYTFYTFLAKPPVLRQTIGNLLDENLAIVISERKWLMLTVPLVIYGIMRYLQLIYERHEGESPEKILLTDKPLLGTVALWGISVVFIIYIAGK